MGGRNSASITLLENVGKMLKEAIIKAEMSQKDLAARLNITEARVSQMLNGQANLTIQSLSKIAVILGCELKIELTNADNTLSLA